MGVVMSEFDDVVRGGQGRSADQVVQDSLVLCAIALSMCAAIVMWR